MSKHISHGQKCIIYVVHTINSNTQYFILDKHEAQIAELDRRLAVADYGEDFEPTEMGHLLKTEFTLNTKLSPEMKVSFSNYSFYRWSP